MSDQMQTDYDAKHARLFETIDELNNAMRSMGRYQAKMEQLTRAMNDEIAAVQKKYSPKLERNRSAYAALAAQVEAYARERRDVLLRGAVRSARLAHGVIRYRAGRPQVVLTEAEDVVIERLEKAGLDHLIRIKRSVDKRAALSFPEDVDAVQGIEIVTAEEQIVIEVIAA